VRGEKLVDVVLLEPSARLEPPAADVDVGKFAMTDELEQLRLGDAQDRRGFFRGVELARDRLAGRAFDHFARRADHRRRQLGG